MGETGHSILKRDVKERDAILGGELSGHIVFNRGYLPIDDALYCALEFLRLLDASGGEASELFADFPDLVSTAEIKTPCPDDVKFDERGVYPVDRPDKAIPFARLASIAYRQRVPLFATGYYRTPDIHFDEDEGQGKRGEEPLLLERRQCELVSQRGVFLSR